MEDLRLRVFKNRLKPGVKRNPNGEWRSPHNEELYSMHSSSNKLKVVKSRILIGSAGQGARKRE